MRTKKTVFRVKTNSSRAPQLLDDYPLKVSVTLDKNAAARILFLANEVKRLGIYKLVEWDSTPGWEKDGFRPECQALNVTDEYFYYDCFPKHCDIAVETATIPLKKLRQRFPGIRARS